MDIHAKKRLGISNQVGCDAVVSMTVNMNVTNFLASLKLIWIYIRNGPGKTSHTVFVCVVGPVISYMPNFLPCPRSSGHFRTPSTIAPTLPTLVESSTFQHGLFC